MRNEISSRAQRGSVALDGALKTVTKMGFERQEAEKHPWAPVGRSGGVAALLSPAVEIHGSLWSMADATNRVRVGYRHPLPRPLPLSRVPIIAARSLVAPPWRSALQRPPQSHSLAEARLEIRGFCPFPALKAGILGIPLFLAFNLANRLHRAELG